MKSATWPRLWPALVLGLLVALTGCRQKQQKQQAPRAPDVIVVGAGLAGLSAAIDAATGGAEVLVIDMNSMWGGHGIQSGGVAIVNSPMQTSQGIEDSPDLAYRDWMTWTVDGHPEWTRFYAERSRELIYDWVTKLGTRFDRIAPSHGNSVPRFHLTHRRGLNLTRPLFLEALRYSNITFKWNTVAQHVRMENGAVVGVQVLNLRQGEKSELRARAVILATGGFQSNIKMVKENWPDDLPVPQQIYSMSGQNSRGSGHLMAVEAGAALVHMDRQYNGYTALPNMLGQDEERGFWAWHPQAIWVNGEGKRFVTERGIIRDVFPRVMQQKPPGFWTIYDEDDKFSFDVRGPHFSSEQGLDTDKIQRLVVGNPDLTVTAKTLAELAERVGLPKDALSKTVHDFNQLVTEGQSTDLDGVPSRSGPLQFTIQTPPFYATRSYPMATKSAGGISIDLGARALDAESRPVPGLYAAGEVTGSAGMNGLHGLDGMFTGPAILTGRVAGRTVVADLAASGSWAVGSFTRDDKLEIGVGAVEGQDSVWTPSLDAKALRAMLSVSRDGYWHFEQSHSLVLERDYPCTRCHSRTVPLAPAVTRTQQLAQSANCDSCHYK